MTDSSTQQQDQRSQTVERAMQQQKWSKFADALRHSNEPPHIDVVVGGGGGERRRTIDGHAQTDVLESPNGGGLKSPLLSDEQQSDLGTDPTADGSSTGMAEDGFELVVNKRNRSHQQRQQKPQVPSVWSSGAAASHLKELHSATTPITIGNSAVQPAANPRVASTVSSRPPPSAKSATQTKTANTKTPQYGLIRCLEEGAENEQDTSNHSSDSAFAENQSPSHGSSTSLHLMGAASENHEFSDSVVALSDDEKWPELGVLIKNEPTVGKPLSSPTSPKSTEAKTETSSDEKTPTGEKDPVSTALASQTRRAPKAQWKKVDIDIMYSKPNEKKHHSSKRSFRSQPGGGSDHHHRNEHPRERLNTTGSMYKRRPQSRKSNMSASDAEQTNNEAAAKSESKPRPSESNEQNHEKKDPQKLNNNRAKTETVEPVNGAPVTAQQQQPQQQHQSYPARRGDAKSSDYNNRYYRNNNANHHNHHNNNNHNNRHDHYNDFNNRRIPRNPRVMRHSVPNLFQCQNAMPMYFLSQDYALAAAAAAAANNENYIQPLGGAPAAPPFMYPNMTSILMPTTTYAADMSYANAHFMGDYGAAGAQNVFQYRPPFVQLSMMPQTVPGMMPGVMPNIAANAPNPYDAAATSVHHSEPSPVGSTHTAAMMNGGEVVAEELAQLFRRIFLDNAVGRTLRDLTSNPNIVAQLSPEERRLVLRHQMRFYFSPDNLAKDLFLRKKMDGEGFAALDLFLTFPRIKILALDYQAIVEVLSEDTEHFELRTNDKQEMEIRSKTLPQEWLTGSSLINRNTVPPPPPPPTTTPPSTVDSAPISTSSSDQNSSSFQNAKKSAPVAVEEISIDDVRRRLTGGRSAKQSPSESPDDTPVNSASASPLTNNNAIDEEAEEKHHQQQQKDDEQSDEWVVYKKKHRQPSANGNASEPESKTAASKPPTSPSSGGGGGKSATAGAKSPRTGIATTTTATRQRD